MTQEEKAKAYDEALERAKEDISSGILARRETARYIFPELRESSEEMVRRTIISTLYRDDYLSTEEVHECVAWLEKQKDIKWGEKDEKMRTRCAACLGYHYCDGMMTKKEYEEASSWLKSLKERLKGE